MKRSTRGLGWIATGAIAGLIACSDEPTTPPESAGARATLTESAEARARVVELRRRFVRGTRVPVIGAGVATSFQRVSGGRVQAVLGEDAPRGARKAARVELPERASGAVRLEDGTSGMAIELSLVGAREVGIALGDGIAVYEGALPGGADVVQRVHAEGTEDYVVFARRPEREELVYRVDVSRAAGLRLVSSVVELLDGQGTPRLRVAPPYVVDAVGKAHAAAIAVEGCAYDTDPRGPWGRAVTAPGAGTCTVRVSWGGVAYPAVVDPAWTTTGSMITKREEHAAIVLETGQVLVVGGVSANLPTMTAELYDPSSRTWSATESMTTAREGHTLSRLLSTGNWPDGILVAGGYDGSTSLKAAEVYVNGTWHAAGMMATARYGHAAPTSAFSNGKVLVTGGYGATNTAELYDPASNTWSAAASMAMARVGHTASLLLNGKVLVAGGGNGVPPSAELFDVTLGGTGAWSLAPEMIHPRSGHTASFMTAIPVHGQILITGGGDSTGTLRSTELYDPLNGASGAWRLAGDLGIGRQGHTASALANGPVLVAGGDAQSIQATAELCTPTAALPACAWSLTATPMTTARAFHTASVLPDGIVLVAGGGTGNSELDTAELYGLFPDGAPCNTASECASGACVNDLCTSSATTSSGTGGATTSSGTGGAATSTGTGGATTSSSSTGTGGTGGATTSTGGTGGTSSSTGTGPRGATSPASFYTCAATPTTSRDTSFGAAALTALLALARKRRRGRGIS